MLGSWFSQLAVTAAVLTVVAVLLVVRAGTRAHRAETGGLARRVRIVEAATVVALAALLGSALLGATAGGAVLVAALLGGSVLAWSPFRAGWTVGAVVAWAGGTTTSVAWLAWLVERVVDSGSIADMLLFAGLGPLAVWGLVGLRRPAQAWLASRGTTAAAGDHALPTRRTFLALGAAVVPALVAAAVVGVGLPSLTPASQGSDAPGTSEPTDGAAPGAEDTGGHGGEAPGSAEETGSAGSSATSGPGRTGDASGSAEASPSPTAGADESATGAPTTDAAAPSEAPSVTESASAEPAEATPTKTPGYDKDQSNRPSDAPSPGGGRDKP